MPAHSMRLNLTLDDVARTLADYYVPQHGYDIHQIDDAAFLHHAAQWRDISRWRKYIAYFPGNESIAELPHGLWTSRDYWRRSVTTHTLLQLMDYPPPRADVLDVGICTSPEQAASAILTALNQRGVRTHRHCGRKTRAALQHYFRRYQAIRLWIVMSSAKWVRPRPELLEASALTSVGLYRPKEYGATYWYGYTIYAKPVGDTL